MVAAMNHTVNDNSNAKRLQRLLDEITLSATDKRHFVLMNRTQVRVSLDRTEWDFGSITNNLLTAAVETNGLAVPVHSKDLGKCGSSSDAERIQAINDTLEVIPVEYIQVLTADREFPSARFLDHLKSKGLSFAVRIKSDAMIKHDGQVKSAAEWFCAYQKKYLRGALVNLCGRRLGTRKGKAVDYLIVVTNLEPLEGYRLYRTRWKREQPARCCFVSKKIETLFGALKSRGFNLESTRVTQSKRLENLVLLLGVAVLWALRVGLWVWEQGEIRVRRDGVALYSLFRLGLDFLRRLLLNPDPRVCVWDDVIRVLSGT